MTDTEPKESQSVVEFNNMAALVKDEPQSKMFVELELHNKVVKFQFHTGASRYMRVRLARESQRDSHKHDIVVS